MALLVASRRRPLRSSTKADNAADLNTALAGSKIIGGVATSVWVASAMTPAGQQRPKTPGDICVGGECTRTPAPASSAPKRYCYWGRKVMPPSRPAPSPAARRLALLDGLDAPTIPPSAFARRRLRPSVKHCVRDPLLSMMAPDERCKGTNACRAGCVPTIPTASSPAVRTRCLPEGNLRLVPPPPDDTMDDMPMNDDGPITRHTGCSTIPGGAGGVWGAAAVSVVGLIVPPPSSRSVKSGTVAGDGCGLGLWL